MKIFLPQLPTPDSQLPTPYFQDTIGFNNQLQQSSLYHSFQETAYEAHRKDFGYDRSPQY